MQRTTGSTTFHFGQPSTQNPRLQYAAHRAHHHTEPRHHGLHLVLAAHLTTAQPPARKLSWLRSALTYKRVR